MLDIKTVLVYVGINIGVVVYVCLITSGRCNICTWNMRRKNRRDQDNYINM
jgi:hypothetical protein